MCYPKASDVELLHDANSKFQHLDSRSEKRERFRLRAGSPDCVSSQGPYLSTYSGSSEAVTSSKSMNCGLRTSIVAVAIRCF
mmetsp:Transcript_24814/g.98076  ORF Transcript_24814/g.98076 Transcript_24814/m.98076 type:complete len:82 (+) Transcript_24814:1019-1264(+)